MAKEANFDDLIQAIQQAFISVNHMSEEQHIAKLSEYFEEDGKPRRFEMQYPYFDESGVPAYKVVPIPHLCLIPITSLKLDEIEVDFKIQLYGKVSLLQQEEDNNDELETNNIEYIKSKNEKNTYLG